MNELTRFGKGLVIVLPTALIGLVIWLNILFYGLKKVAMTIGLVLGAVTAITLLCYLVGFLYEKLFPEGGPEG